MKTAIFEKVLLGYITAMLWSSVDVHPNTGEYLDSLEGYELSLSAKTLANTVVFGFTQANVRDCELFTEVYDPKGYDVWECLGHDLWLTSAGHGVGFWDRGLGDLGGRLTEACKPFEMNVYLGDDLLVYLS